VHLEWGTCSRDRQIHYWSYC